MKTTPTAAHRQAILAMKGQALLAAMMSVYGTPRRPLTEADLIALAEAHEQRRQEARAAAGTRGRLGQRLLCRLTAALSDAGIPTTNNT